MYGLRQLTFEMDSGDPQPKMWRLLSLGREMDAKITFLSFSGGVIITELDRLILNDIPATNSSELVRDDMSVRQSRELLQRDAQIRFLSRLLASNR